MAADECAGVRPRSLRLQQCCQSTRDQFIVCIKQQHMLPSCSADATIARRRCACIGLMNHTQKWVLQYIIRQHIGSLVSGSVVYDNNLDPLILLRENRIKRTRKKMRVVIGGDDHADAQLSVPHETYAPAFTTNTSSMIRYCRSDPKNMLSASVGEQIIGSPRRLSEVLRTTPLPVSFSSSFIKS